METKMNLIHLQKYLPFIDYMLTNESSKETAKLSQIKEWILSSNMFKKSDADNIEKYVLKSYREFKLKKKLPKSIGVIFKEAIVTVDSIDLCSDDEDEKSEVDCVELLSDDDVVLIETNGSRDNEVSLFKRRNEIFSTNIDKDCTSEKVEKYFSSDLQKTCPIDSRNSTIQICNSENTLQRNSVDAETRLEAESYKYLPVVELEKILDKLLKKTGLVIPPVVRKNVSSEADVSDTSDMFSCLKYNNQSNGTPSIASDLSVLADDTTMKKSTESIVRNSNFFSTNTSRIPPLLSSVPTAKVVNIQTQRNLDIFAQVQHILKQNSNLKSVPLHNKGSSVTSYRPNPKDPRIRRFNEANNSLSRPTTLEQNISHCNEARTYGEYKRQKVNMEKAAELTPYQKSVQLKQIEKVVEHTKQPVLPENQPLKTSRTSSSTCIDTYETNCVNHNTVENTETTQLNGNPLGTPKKAKRPIDKVDRVLKNLVVDCIGYKKLTDFVSKSGKRQSGISARAAIALQLNLPDAMKSVDTSSTPIIKENRISKRRKTINNDFNIDDMSVKGRFKRQRRSSVCMDSLKASAAKGAFQPEKQNKPTAVEDVNSTPKDLSKPSTQNEDSRVINEQQKLCQNVRVVLQKLKPIKKVPPLSPKLASTKVIKKGNRGAEIPNFGKRNTNKLMTEQNTRTCIICKSNPHNLTNHFVGRHKTESYVARLTNEQLDDLRVNIPYAILVSVNSSSDNTSSPTYAIKCQFCAKEIVDEVHKLYDHYSSHTGEFAYSCSGCGLMKPFYQEVKTHTANARRCAKVPIKRLYTYPAEQMVINLHSCKICNFVQLNAANVDKHLREQHGKKYNPACIETHVLASIQNEEENEDVDVGVENENPNDILICNELLLDEPFDIGAGFHANEFEDVAMVSIEETKPNFNELSVKLGSISNLLVKKKNSRGVNSADDGHQHLQSDDYKLIPAKVSYFGLLKCMGAECFYSTNNDLEFIAHINDHQNSECPTEEILCCAYCLHKCVFKESEDLIKHIKENHGRSLYQCYYCCYRSCEPGNVLVHQQSAHIDTEAIIVKCSGQVVSHIEMFPYMLKLMAENVRMLICETCALGFYAISSIADHKRKYHNTQSDNLAFKYYECIYCPLNYFALKNLQTHMVNCHPNEHSFVCERSLRKMDKDDNVYDLVHRNIANADSKKYIKLWSDLEVESDKKDCCPVELDVKPGYENLLYINEEAVKALLLKLTKHTGIPPDRLYVCPKPTCGGIFSNFENWYMHMKRRHRSLIALCPHRQHCKFTEYLDVEKFDEHFKLHCRHLSVCFHCAESFGNDLAINKHMLQAHFSNTETRRVDRIEVNINYTYFISISTEQHTKRLDFLQTLQDTLRQRVAHLQNENSCRIASRWSVPLTTEWIEGFPSFSVQIDERVYCMVENCYFLGKNMSELMKHNIVSHRVGFSWRYSCKICSFNTILSNNWDTIELHLGMHGENLYICCACSYYHYDRNAMVQHCRQQHDLRDVPIVALNRSRESINLSLSIVFALNCITFSTLRACFCCNMRTENSYTLVKHLKDVHKLILSYACEDCDTTLNLAEARLHFKTRHFTESFKIRCVIQSFMDRQLIVQSLNPLEVNIEEREANLHNNYFNVQRLVKLERNDEVNDIEIVEDDEIEILKNEVDGQNKINTSNFRIKCVHVNNLM